MREVPEVTQTRVLHFSVVCLLGSRRDVTARRTTFALVVNVVEFEVRRGVTVRRMTFALIVAVVVVEIVETVATIIVLIKVLVTFVVFITFLPLPVSFSGAGIRWLLIS